MITIMRVPYIVPCILSNLLYLALPLPQSLLHFLLYLRRAAVEFQRESLVYKIKYYNMHGCSRAAIFDRSPCGDDAKI